MSRFSVDPSIETPVQIIERSHFKCRYAYARSADSQAGDDVGQDYLSVWYDASRLTFVLCDGVSQSFYGDIAARYLAENLVGWLARLPVAGLSHFHNALTGHLNKLTEEAAAYVNQTPIPSELPEMLRDVLAQKQAQGSQTTFICGRVEFVGADGKPPRLYLAWMGDSRLRIWGANRECSELLGGKFVTQERWSTHKGLIGPVLHSFSVPTETIRRIAAYTDGLDLLDSQPTIPNTEKLSQLIQQATQSPTSDDIALLDLQYHVPAATRLLTTDPPQSVQAQLKPDHLLVSWDSDPDACYHLEIGQQGQAPYLKQTDTNQWALFTYSPGTTYRFRVRAIQGSTVGDWSDVCAVATPAGASAASTAQRKPRARRRQASAKWPTAVLLVLLLTLCSLWYIAANYRQEAAEILPTATSQPVALPPTPIIVPTITPAPTETPVDAPSLPPPTNTPEPTPIPTATATYASVFMEAAETRLSHCYLVNAESGLAYYSEPNEALFIGVIPQGDIIFGAEQTEFQFSNETGLFYIELLVSGEPVWAIVQPLFEQELLSVPCLR